MKKISTLLCFISLLCSSAFAATNLDEICKQDEDSDLKEIYSIQRQTIAKEGIVVCGPTKSLETKNDFSVIQYKKNGKTYDRATLFESDDAFMTYEIQPAKDFFAIKENLSGELKSDTLFIYAFDCDDDKCGRKLKTCAVKKTATTGNALISLEKDHDKLQKLNKKNNSDYEKRIRQIFLDALAGDNHSVQFFQKNECGWNNYVDIDEACATYGQILEENLKHPCH